ncbi:phage fiber-tail adaptor protein [Massilia sp. DD77]|uniref:phage fiber-tail adaptor protein n=1 Tax=Massilia sp. DD77 TaxID=3109349 RepID=UPI00300078FD
MLRNLARPNTNGGGILGTHLVGVPASELPVGFPLPGLLNNDVAQGDPAGTLYRVEIIDWPSAGELHVEENGAFSFTDAPDGTYTGATKVYKNNLADDGAYEFVIGAAGLTQVSSDLVLTYATLSQVSADLVVSYSTLSRVSSDLVLTWQLLGNSGMSFTPSKARTIVVGVGPKPFSAEGDFWNLTDQKKPRGTKDPNATIDITFDFAPWLADMGSPEIAGVVFILVGCQDAGQFAQGSKLTIFISGGTGQEIAITCRPTTATTPARTDDRTVYLTLGDQ